MLTHLFTLSSLIISVVQAQLESPCPQVLQYEPRIKGELDRWYGVVTLSTTEDLDGLWLKIILNGQAYSLGNSFAVSDSSDGIEYSIEDLSYTFEAGSRLLIRFFVQYNADDIVPTVKRILLNGQQICPSRKTPSTGPTLFISQLWQPNGTTGSSPSITATTSTTTNRPVIVGRQPVQCGTVAQRATPLISNGQNTTPGQWPWHAALYRLKNIEFIYTCGATLISEQFVVTTANCVTRSLPDLTIKPVDETSLVIHLGKYNIAGLDNEVQPRAIEKIYVHPSYSAIKHYNDIAILKLNSPVVFDNFVRPSCLWEDETSNIDDMVGQEGTIYGWCLGENNLLKQAHTPIVSAMTCRLSNPKLFSQVSLDNNFCAGLKNGACPGISGGSMVMLRNGLWQMRGIIAAGVPRQGEAVEDSFQYVLFVDVAKYVQWVKTITLQV